MIVRLVIGQLIEKFPLIVEFRGKFQNCTSLENSVTIRAVIVQFIGKFPDCTCCDSTVYWEVSKLYVQWLTLYGCNNVIWMFLPRSQCTHFQDHFLSQWRPCKQGHPPSSYPSKDTFPHFSGYIFSAHSVIFIILNVLLLYLLIILSMFCIHL